MRKFWGNKGILRQKNRGNLQSFNRRNFRADSLSLLLSALRPRLLWLGALVFAGFLFCQTAYPLRASAASLTLSVPSADLSVTLDPSANDGFAKSETKQVSIQTDANWGYSLSIKSKTDENGLKNGENTLESIDGNGIDESTFKTGDTYNNRWGFLPSKINGGENTKFVAGPEGTPTVLEQTQTENSSATTSYDVTIAAKADNTLVAGSYTNTFVLTGVANTVSYNITYNLNDGVWTKPTKQEGSTVEKDVQLFTDTPTKEGFEFKGWCDQETTDGTCKGNTYQPGQKYQLKSGTISLAPISLFCKHNNPKIKYKYGND